MPTDNRKAPTVRSGDEINPILGSIIKIGGLIVIAALAVLITFIIIEAFKKDTIETGVYDDNHHLSYNDFELLTKADHNYRNWDDIKDDDIRDIMLGMEDQYYYIYFYYESLIDDLPEDEVEKLSNIDEHYPIFFVNLESRVNTGDENSTIETYLDVFDSQMWIDTEITFSDDKDLVMLNKEVTLSFVIRFNEETTTTSDVSIVSYRVNELETFVSTLPQKPKLEEDVTK